MKAFLSIVFLFLIFFSATGQDKKTQKLHYSLISIDSHTDTPLDLLDPDFRLGEKHDPYENGSRLDIPRMDEGGLDGVFFAVFVGQRERNPENNEIARNKALQIFDSIHSNINRYSDELELAIKADDIYRIARKNKHAIYIGVENGFPIGNDLDLIDTFYNKGARYMTLCHTSNNDICDSSTDEKGPEHGGLSDFGEEVVKRMSELGMMIDVSHISDESFYDVLKISKLPVIASHSCARALCDNPRNLNDDMLEKLAENNGVIQMCLLSAYLEKPAPNPSRDSAKNAVRAEFGNYNDLSEEDKREFLKAWYGVDRTFPPNLTNVSKLVDHIDHIVKITGIDHVGIGSDFDGGGGISDCYDISQFPAITDELLQRGYSKKDIQKIWGGNLLRVMRSVENHTCNSMEKNKSWTVKAYKN
jgi:membrane dipeptidase